MRNPTLAVVRSYLRPLTLVVPGVFVIALLFLQTGGRPLVESSPKHLVRVVFHFLAVLSMLGVFLVAHLKQMLGSNVAQLVPHLHGAHLKFAAATIVSATTVLPAVLCCLTGNSDAILPMIAVCLVTLTIVVSMTNGYPSSSFLLAFAPAYLALVGSDFWIEAARRLPGAAGSTVLIALASVALYWQGRRLACFNEELPEFHWHVPANSVTQRAIVNSPTDFRWGNPIPFEREIQRIKTWGPAANDNVFRRALRFRVAWQPFWTAIIVGSMIGFMDVASYALFSGHGGNPYFPMSRMSFIGAMPAMFVCHPAGRAFVVQRMMWPYSRKQFVQGWGLLLGMACALCWLAMHLISLACLVLLFAVNPLTPDSMRQLALSAAAMPLYFGLFTRPWQGLQFAWPIVLIGLFVGVGYTLQDAMHDWGWWPVVALAAGLFAIGCCVTYLSYRRWHSGDVE